MPWQIPMLIRVVVGYLIAPTLMKKVAKAPSRTRNLVWQYFFAALFAIIVAVALHAPLWDKRIAMIMLIGAFNAFACYCQWRAVAISLSKTSIATQWDDIITLALGYLVLKEGKLLNPFLALGVVLSVGAAMFFTLYKGRKTGQARDVTADGSGGRGLVVWVALYSIVWGVAVFSLRYFALDGVSLCACVAAWYSGSFCGALVVFALGGKKEAGERLRWRQIAKGPIPLAAIIWGCMMLSYWVTSLAPITVTQPIYQVSEMVLPTIVGLWWFKEAKELRAIDKLAFATGIAGGLIIALSY